jgi:hypothetical protein
MKTFEKLYENFRRFRIPSLKKTAWISDSDGMEMKVLFCLKFSYIFTSNSHCPLPTQEYRKIVSSHPKVRAVTPVQFRAEYERGTRFDAIVSFSSLEHAGLGRYGDALNPWGDVIQVAKAWCVVKSGGTMVG